LHSIWPAAGLQREGMDLMKALFVTAVLTATLSGIGAASAFDSCGPGCHATVSGACVVDGWGTGVRVRNECPAGAQPRPPCPAGYTWFRSMHACFLT
jgi:hypothetical protein